MAHPRSAPARSAYTLVEVLVVVVILGIIGAIVVPQMLAAGTFGVQGAVRATIADIMYAQNDAMAKQLPRQVIFDVANGRYRLTDGDGKTLDASWKGGTTQNYAVDFGGDPRFAGVRIVSADFGGEPVLRFDDLGAPASGGRIVLSYNDQRYRITVAAFTGRVTVDKL